MNWAGLWTWALGNYGAVIAAIMVIVRLVESALAAGKAPVTVKSQTVGAVLKEFFKLG